MAEELRLYQVAGQIEAKGPFVDPSNRVNLRSFGDVAWYLPWILRFVYGHSAFRSPNEVVPYADNSGRSDVMSATVHGRRAGLALVPVQYLLL